MAHWVGAQSQAKLVKKRETPPLMSSPTENSKPKSNKIFSISPSRLPESVEDLDSSLAQGCQTRFSSGANSGKFNLKRAGPM